MLPGRLAAILPLVSASMTLPVVTGYGNWKICKKHAAIGNALVRFIKSNVERLTTGTPRLLVFAHAIYIEVVRRFLYENFAGGFSILGTNQKLYANNKM